MIAASRKATYAGIALVAGGVLAHIAAAALVAVVVWLEMSNPAPPPYFTMAIRAIVLGGFFLFLGWLMLRVGRSLMASRHAD